MPDVRRIEIVCNGLPLWHGAELAVVTTCVSPVTRSGELRPGADSQPGLGLQQATRRKRRDTYPELARLPRCHLVVFAVRGWWPLRSSRKRELSVRMLPFGRRCVRRMCFAGAASSPLRRQRALAGCLLELLLDTVASAAGEPAVHRGPARRSWLHVPAPTRLPQRTWAAGSTLTAGVVYTTATPCPR